jgi:hypothetical protein
MEDNLDAVRETQKNLRTLSNKHYFETYKATLPSRTAGELSGELGGALNARADAVALLDSQSAAAARAVNDALDREAAVTKANEETVKDRGSVGDTLDRLKKRLAWVDKVFAGLDKIEEVAGKVGLTDAGPAVVAGGAPVADFTKKAKTALDNVEKDERVSAATKLLKQAVQEAAVSEQARVMEMRRHLGEIQRLQAEFATRDTLAVCRLLPAALGQIQPGAGEEDARKLTAAVLKLKEIGAPAALRYPCLNAFGPDPAAWVPEPRRTQVKTAWKDDTLSSFVAADLAARGKASAAPLAVAALGILLFPEQQYLDEVRLDLAREAHRHSIRLSKVNALERAQLVNQLAQGLEVYYQGGVKPEELAQLLLMAGQVAALGFIGAQQ